ncbi:MAG: metal-dependent phosphohydrolase [Microlunatus sp.]|nr:metal-dependent phosphohydrolase [Microlunatus sp.]MDN5770588.1 metal-dependent phosphohydrolase [Microlunatus sp.]MDN5803483.1 metal-dependent phosphohydrolase [Microlunatus sp.]
MLTEDTDLTTALQAIWDATLPRQSEIGAAVIARYAEPHRYYHSTEHLAAVLEHIESLAGDHDLFLVRLAAFFHDAVYAIPVGQVSNEEASARLSIRELSRAGLEQEDLNEVARLVRLTATHLPGPRDPEGELLCDADLAVLAGSPEAYERYVQQVRQEYAAVPRLDFVRGRFQILRELAGRDLFRTANGRAMNAPARINLVAECRALAAELRAAGVSPDEIGPVPGSTT